MQNMMFPHIPYGLFILVAALLPLLGNAGAASSHVFRPELSHQVEYNLTEGGIEILTTGEDPYVVFFPSSSQVPSDELSVLELDYFSPEGIRNIEVHYAHPSDNPIWSPSQCIGAGRIPSAEGWQKFRILLPPEQWQSSLSAFRIDLGQQAGARIKIRQLRLTPPTSEELLGASERNAIRESRIREAGEINRVLEKEYAGAEIRSISANKEKITISAHLNPEYVKGAVLMEWLPHENEWQDGTGRVVQEIPTESELTIELSRFENERDRIASRFAIVSGEGANRNLLTYPHWVTELKEAAEREMPRLRPSNLKGIGGVVSEKLPIWDEDFQDLGITAATVNFLLSKELFYTGEDAIRFSYQGRTWQFNPAIVGEWDRTIQELTKRSIVVTAILLIEPDNDLLAHPLRAENGIYAMVNLTTQEATDTFRAVVAFLADRYSQPDKLHGWITHWILFNEVDSAWIWTNMGEQPMELFMEHYHRALRLAWLEVRRYNPTAEVFISLTNAWDVEPQEPLHTYAPRAMMDRLARYSLRAGDFAWGIAYHPYPESIFHQRTWNDTGAKFRYNTPKITPKNLEVLSSYLHQKQFLYEGKVRTLLLSEQGFHTPDYTKESFTDQAAAIAYTWKKMEAIGIVESFHFHRWVDHPLEGGLLLGLRTLPSESQPFGIRKQPAFDTLSALQTPHEEDVIAPIKKIIGISEWKEIIADKF